MPSRLPSDVQTALVNAVDRANNAYARAQDTVSPVSATDAPSKKKKRKRIHAEDAGGLAEAAPADDQGELRKKKKRKKDKGKEANGGETAAVLVPDNVAPSAEEVLPDATTSQAFSADTDAGTKKRKKKDKGKQRSRPSSSEDQSSTPLAVEPQAYTTPQAFVAALLSGTVPADSAVLHDPAYASLQGSSNVSPDMYAQPGHGEYIYDGPSDSNPQFPYPNSHQPFPPPAHPYPGLDPSFALSQDMELSMNADHQHPANITLTNEELLRTLEAVQSLDVSKLADVIKLLGNAAAAASISVASNTEAGPSAQNRSLALPITAPAPGSAPRPQGNTISAPVPGSVPPSLHYAGHQHAQRTSTPSRLSGSRIDMNAPTPVGQKPMSSSTIMNPTQRGSTLGPQNDGEMTHPEHANMLATRWMNTVQLGELVKSQGLVYKKGKFSGIEDQQLEAAIDRYRAEKGLSDEQMNELVFSKDKTRDTTFWSELTSAVPQRPIIAVYHHVRRMRHPAKSQGKWSSEEDALLTRAVLEHGPSWEKVCVHVGRMASDCRDRYRNHLAERSIRNNGTWSQAEEETLTKIVKEMTVDQGKDIDSDIFWSAVSERMGKTRGRQQCRIKWTDSLSKQVKNGGVKLRWGQQDAYILVHKVDSLNVKHDSEIDWKSLPDEKWNFWSAHMIQRRWFTLKKSVKGWETMAHSEIMDILRTKKAHMPTTPTLSRTPRKVTSTEEVRPELEDDDDDDELDGMVHNLDAALEEDEEETLGAPEAASITPGIVTPAGDRDSEDADALPDTSVKPKRKKKKGKEAQTGVVAIEGPSSEKAPKKKKKDKKRKEALEG